MCDKLTWGTQRWRRTWAPVYGPSWGLLFPTLLLTTAPSWRVSHLPERGDHIFSKLPKSQRKSPSFLPKTSLDVQNQDQGGAATVTSTQRQGLSSLGKEGEFQCFWDTVLQHLSSPVAYCLLTSERKLATTFGPIRILIPRLEEIISIHSSISKDQPRPSSGFSPKDSPLSLLASNLKGQSFSTLSV